MRRRTKIILISAGLILVIGAVVGGVVALQSQSRSEESTPPSLPVQPEEPAKPVIPPNVDNLPDNLSNEPYESFDKDLKLKLIDLVNSFIETSTDSKINNKTYPYVEPKLESLQSIDLGIGKGRCITSLVWKNKKLPIKKTLCECFMIKLVMHTI